MTDSQKETIRFYATNDYLLINGILWNESDENIDKYIKLINDDGRGVIKAALEQTPEVLWNCSSLLGFVPNSHERASKSLGFSQENS